MFNNDCVAYFIDFFLCENSPITPLMEKNYSLGNFYVTKAKLDGLVEAVAAPRLHQQWRPKSTRFEGGWSEALIKDLEGRGHPVSVEPRASFASVQAIRVRTVTGEDGEPERVVEVASDPRRGGAGGIEGQGITEPAKPK